VIAVIRRRAHSVKRELRHVVEADG